jgi:Flp pilus assembly pilin Flp
MQKALNTFWNEENGQDMVEYTLLLGVFALCGAAVLVDLRNEMTIVWKTINTSFGSSATSVS